MKADKTTCFLGDALKFDNGKIEFTVPLNVGPRIISLGKSGGANIFFHDEENAIIKDVSSVYGEGEKWHIYGGHRLWLSPEGEDTYYPDNHPIKAEILDDGVRLSTYGPWKVLNVFTEMEVRFVSENTLSVTHRVKNLGADRPLCIWALTVLKTGGKMEFDMETLDTGYLPNRNLVLWPYTDIRDPRLELYDNKVVIKSSANAPKPLKIGAYNAHPGVVYTLGENVFKKTWEVPQNANFPDFECNFETYTSNLIHEIESLSPITLTKAGESIEHTEYWELS